MKIYKKSKKLVQAWNSKMNFIIYNDDVHITTIIHIKHIGKSIII